MFEFNQLLYDEIMNGMKEAVSELPDPIDKLVRDKYGLGDEGFKTIPELAEKYSLSTSDVEKLIARGLDMMNAADVKK